MEDAFDFADKLGPLKVIHIHQPSLGLKATLVVDNVALGPAIGGLRMAEDASPLECFRLARAMTLKNAAAGIAHGGGKSVLYADPKQGAEEKEQLVRCLACALKEVDQYIFGPDMGTDETCMAWINDEIGRSVGLPKALGGIPLDELGATAWGLFHAIDVTAQTIALPLKGARIAIQGFGAVGQHAARFLVAQGAVIVGVADSKGSCINPEGLDLDHLMARKRSGLSVADVGLGQAEDREAIIDVPCDVWIPAARPDIITAANVHRLKTRIVAQGANIAVTTEAEATLYKKGVICLPDFIANAGGVICAAMEYKGLSERATFKIIEEKLRENTRIVLDASRDQQILPRQAATALALQRLERAMKVRRWSIF